MFYTILLSVLFLVGVVYVAFSTTPGFAAGVLVVVSGVGCGIVAVVGGFFLALVLFLVYLGGMLVVFAFSVGMTVDLQFEWEMRLVDTGISVGYCVMLCVAVWWGVSVGEDCWQVEFGSVGEVAGGLDSGFGGVCELYSYGGPYLFIAGWVLLLTLFVVLELVRGGLFGALK